MTMMSSLLLPIFLALPAPIKVGLILFGGLTFGTAVKVEKKQAKNHARVRVVQEEQRIAGRHAQRLAEHEREQARRLKEGGGMVIALGDEGTYSIEGKKNQTKEQLSEALLQAGKAKPQRKIYIRATKKQTHKEVTEVLKLCRDAGLKKISFVSLPNAAK